MLPQNLSSVLRVIVSCGVGVRVELVHSNMLELIQSLFWKTTTKRWIKKINKNANFFFFSAQKTDYAVSSCWVGRAERTPWGEVIASGPATIQFVSVVQLSGRSPQEAWVICLIVCNAKFTQNLFKLTYHQSMWKVIGLFTSMSAGPVLFLEEDGKRGVGENVCLRGWQSATRAALHVSSWKWCFDVFFTGHWKMRRQLEKPVSRVNAIGKKCKRMTREIPSKITVFILQSCSNIYFFHI